MEIREGSFNTWKDDLKIENYPNLENIVVKKNSLNSLNSLKIYNCEKLKIIMVENWSFGNAKDVIIESDYQN